MTSWEYLENIDQEEIQIVNDTNADDYFYDESDYEMEDDVEYADELIDELESFVEPID